ncbi:MAG: PAS domain-containing sensor histidine kinase [Anaerolineae bacterium]|nr:PAS domain-containing sensor histidine kinase [Anaerolineae bacterium]
MNVTPVRIWYLLTEPSNRVIPVEHRRQGRVLSALLFILIFGSLLGLFVDPDYGVVWPGVLVGTCMAYGLSRTRYVNLAILISLISLTAPPFIILIAEKNYAFHPITHHLSWLVLPVLFGNLVLPVKRALIVTGLINGGVLALAIILEQIGIYDVLESGGLLWSASILILLSNFIRQDYIVQLRSANCLLADQSVALTCEIAEHKRTAEQLRASEERFRGLFEHAPISLWEEDFSAVKHHLDDLRAQGVTDFRAYFAAHPEALSHCATLVKILDVNESSLRIFRANSKEAMLLSLADFFTDDSYNVFQEELIALAHGETRFQCEIIGQPMTGDSINCRVDVSIAPGAEADWAKVFVSVQDITEQIKAQQALQESETRYRTLVEMSPETILVHCQGKVVYINPAGVRLFGAAEARDLIGVPIMNFIHPDFHAQTRLRVEHVQLQGELMPFRELRLLRSDGQPFFAEATANRILYEGQIATQTLIHDITARKAAEQREKDLITEREKVRALEEFINDLSHDFRTPLTVINTHIYLLQRRLSDEKQLKQLDLMYKHATRLMKMVDDMIEMFELDMQLDLPMAPVDLNAILRTFTTDYQVLAAEKKQTLVLDVPDSPQLVWGHKNGLGRVLINLVMNALQFTREGGSITIRTTAQGWYVYLEVRDTGIGIPATDRPHIFKRFFRGDKTRSTEGGGTGLGLTIAEKIIERHQGRIEVDSMEGQGSTFRVILPQYSAICQL